MECIPMNHRRGSSSVFDLVQHRQYGVAPPWGAHFTVKDSKETVQKLQKWQVLQGHSGCVNTIAWNEDGSLLLSGSDDYLLNIYDVYNEQLVHSVQSGHRANIFSAKFLPFSSDSKIVSCSGDGVLHYNEVGAESYYGQNCFYCHAGTAYEVLATPGDAHSFLSCGEDGTVRFYDLRTKSKCQCDGCSDDILIDTGHAVTAISVNPVIPYQVAAGCKDSTVRLFDRRFLGTSLANRSVLHATRSTRGMFCQFRPKQLQRSSCRVTSLHFSDDGRECLVSYCTDYVYLFAVNKSECKKYTSLSQSDAFANGQSSAEDGSIPPMKRLRLRGDWSDTGPQARPEAEDDTAPESSLMRRMSELFSSWLDDAMRSSVRHASSSTDTELSDHASTDREDEDDDGERLFRVAADSVETRVGSSLADATVSAELVNSSDASMLSAGNSVSVCLDDNASQPRDTCLGIPQSKEKEIPCTTDEVRVGPERQSALLQHAVGSAPVDRSVSLLPKSTFLSDSGISSNHSSSSNSLSLLSASSSDRNSPVLDRLSGEHIPGAYDVDSRTSDLNVTLGCSPIAPCPVQQPSGDACGAHAFEGEQTATGCHVSHTNGTDGNQWSGGSPTSSDNRDFQSFQQASRESPVRLCFGVDSTANLPEERCRSTMEQHSTALSCSHDQARNAAGRASEQRTSVSRAESARFAIVRPRLHRPIEIRNSSVRSGRGLNFLDRNVAARRIQNFVRAKKAALHQANVEDIVKEVILPVESHVYKGHRNARTMIKEANFWGSKYVMSGSDCGRIFIWDKESEELVMLLQGDRHVVNCLQPHPFDPILASSGIDHDIKIWAPIAQEPARLDGVEDILRRNERMLDESRDTIAVPASFLLRMLASFGSLRRVRREVNDTGLEEDEGESSAN